MTPPHPIHAGAPAQLCRACGLCCRGVLFGSTPLEAGDDAAQLAALGLRVGRINGRLRFEQPCPALEPGGCRVYAQRPQACRTFECRLLQEVCAGQVSVPAALVIIHHTLEKEEEVRQALTEAGDTAGLDALSRRCARCLAPAADPGARAGVLAAVFELSRELRGQFHEPDPGDESG